MDLTMIQALERALKANKEWTLNKMVETITPLQSLELKYGNVPQAQSLEDAYEYSKYLYVSEEINETETKVYFKVSTIVENPNNGFYNTVVCLGEASSLFSGFNTIAVDKEAPTDESKLWMKVNEDGNFTDQFELGIPELLDDEISEIDTWSSKKINEELSRFSLVPALSMYDNIICIGDGQMNDWTKKSNGEIVRCGFSVPQTLGNIFGFEKIVTYCASDYCENLKTWMKHYIQYFENNLSEINGLSNPIFLLMFGAETYEYDTKETEEFIKNYETLLSNEVFRDKNIVIIVPERANNDVKEYLNNLTSVKNCVIINITKLENGFYHIIDDKNPNVEYYNEIGYTKLAAQIVDSINALSPKELYRIKPKREVESV